MPILDAPKKYAVHMTPTGDMQFRHPYAVDAKGYGIGIKLGYRKESPTRRGEVLEQAILLLKEAPRKPDDWKGPPLDPDLSRAYFKHLPQGVEDTKEFKNAQKALNMLPKGHEIRPGEPTVSISVKALESLEWESIHWRTKYEKAIKDNATLQAQVNELVKATGERSDFEKSLTLKEAFAHWTENQSSYGDGGRFSCQEQSEDTARRIRYVVEKLGEDMRFPSLTGAKVKQAVEDTKAVSEKEKGNRQKAIKRFFKDLMLPRCDGGLAISFDPAQTIRVKDVRGKINKDILSPKERLESAKLSAYWKTYTACMGFASLRASEAFSLTWENIDFQKQLIHIRPTEVKPGFKTKESERPVMPIENLWDMLKAHKATQKPNERFVFPKPNGDSWFVISKGKASSTPGLRVYYKALADADLKTHDPCLRLRRWWTTQMRSRGLHGLESMMGAHTREESAKHYFDVLEALKGVKMFSVEL